MTNATNAKLKREVLERCRRRSFSRRLVAYVLAPTWVGLLLFVSVIDSTPGWAGILSRHGITQNHLNLSLALTVLIMIALILYSNLCPLCSIGFFRGEGRAVSKPLGEISGVCSRCKRSFDENSFIAKRDNKP